MELQPYNGWENKFTWLVHLHLSNEAVLSNEITALVVGIPDDRAAGRFVEAWVQATLTNWLIQLPDRAGSYDDYIQLLAWDLVGSTLAYADWDALVRLLTGQATTSENLFTETLSKHIAVNSELQQAVLPLVSQATSIYACADGLKEWFREQLDAWIAALETGQYQGSFMAALAFALIQNTCEVICWEHMARAFRPEY